MKKTLLLLAVVLCMATANAQSNFFIPTSYRGAFSPDTTKDWTKGWTNWDPQNKSYPAPTVNINPGDITSSTTWTKNNVYLINGGYVYLTNNATLTIEAGTIIRGTGKGALIVCRGSKIIAKGTVSEPIIFTSNQGAGLRAPGDWGGLVLTGKATHNKIEGDTAASEGGIAKALPSSDGRYGGNDDNDSSGVLEYVRLEFGGIPLSTAANSEINGITFYSVGRKTKVDHIQVSYSGDDAFEWFGGTVDCRHLISYGVIDDDFDTDNGYRGNVQFGVALRDDGRYDQSTSNGFESDNDANGSTRTPQTAAVFSNMTIIGPITANRTSVNSLFGRGAHIRRNSAISIFNSIFMGWRDAGILIDSRLTNSNLQTPSKMELKKNIIAGTPGGNNGKLASASDTLLITSSGTLKAAMFGTGENDSLATSEGVDLIRGFFPVVGPDPNFAPATASIAKTNADFSSTKLPKDLAAVKPVAAFTYVQSSSSGSRDVTFTNNSDAKGFTPTWSWNFGTGTSAVMSPVYSFPSNGNYTVWLKVNTQYGVDSTSTNLSVFATGIDHIVAQNQVMVYPNPAGQLLNVHYSLNNERAATISLMDATGRLVKTIRTDAHAGINAGQISLDGLSKGIYFVHIEAGSELNSTVRISVIK